jgi:hypothetical protein
MRKFSILAAAAAMTAGTLSADVQIGKGLSVGGYLDMVFQTVDQASDDTAAFNVNTAELDFAMDFGSGLSAQVDLEGTVGSDSDGTLTTNELAIEQARIDYAFGNSTLTFGKFDTFIGLEGMEAPDLYQYSNSLTWAIEPLQHEGVVYAYDAGMWNFAAALVNSYGSNNGNSDGASNNEEFSYALHVGLTPVDTFAVNVNYAIGNDEVHGFSYGAVDTNGDGERNDANLVPENVNVITVDASYSNHGWTLGAEYVSQDWDNSADVDAYMVMANYMFTERFGSTVRYSASELDVAGDSSINELTLAASYAVTPNWNALIEYRTESADAGAEEGLAANGLIAGDDADIITLRTYLTF